MNKSLVFARGLERADRPVVICACHTTIPWGIERSAHLLTRKTSAVGRSVVHQSVSACTVSVQVLGLDRDNMNRRFEETPDLLAEAQSLNWHIAQRRAALESRELELVAELEYVRTALATLPTPSAAILPVWANEQGMDVRRLSAAFDVDASESDESATERVLRLLSDSNEPLTASDVMERIAITRRPLSPGVVHSALSRLNSRGDIQAIGERGERRYLASIANQARNLGRRIGSQVATCESRRCDDDLARKRNR